jgi:predicted aminopeptidase
MHKPLLVLFAALGLSGCGAGYLLQAARGQWQVQHQRAPIEQLLASESTEPKLKVQLEMVRQAREFASRELGLPDNASYRSYRALNRPYVVWNVVAAPEFSTEPKRWCFLVVGCVSYRGYFHEASAQRYAAKLQRRRYDVLVAGVAAYSTLGKLSDPLLDTMLRYGDLELVGTLFHELAHQIEYVASDSEFNESFAMAVEREGLRRWTEVRGKGGEYRTFMQNEARQAGTVERLTALRQQLGLLYGSHRPEPELRAAKAALLSHSAANILDYERTGDFRSGYHAWLQSGLNNAHLAAVATYFGCVPAFERLLLQQQSALAEFYAAVRRLANAAPAARRQFCAGG